MQCDRMPGILFEWSELGWLCRRLHRECVKRLDLYRGQQISDWPMFLPSPIIVMLWFVKPRAYFISPGWSSPCSLPSLRFFPRCWLGEVFDPLSSIADVTSTVIPDLKVLTALLVTNASLFAIESGPLWNYARLLVSKIFAFTSSRQHQCRSVVIRIQFGVFMLYSNLGRMP